jgi:predicted nucleotide-binding protein
MPASTHRCHPDDDSLDNFVRGQLSEQELDPVEQHLFVCHSCQLRVAHIDEIKAGLATEFSRTVFISHGGQFLKHVYAVRDLLTALGFSPIVARYMPNLGESTNAKVDACMRICRAAVVLATADDEVGASCSLTRPNVQHEIGMLQAMPRIKNRIVYMKEPSVAFPSNYAEKTWIEFKRQRIQDVFIPLIEELMAFAL